MKLYTVKEASDIAQSNSLTVVFLEGRMVDMTCIGGSTVFNLYSHDGHCIYYNVTIDTQLNFTFYNLIPLTNV
jgi:hypothetical protein